MDNSRLIYGAGGHARVVIDCLRRNRHAVGGIFDDDPAKTDFMGITIQRYSPTLFSDRPIIIAIGDNRKRQQVAERVQHDFAYLQSAEALMSAEAQALPGTMVLPGAHVNAQVCIGRHCIINTCAIVEHDCIIRDFAHIATAAVLCGGVEVGEGALIGANATVLPGIRIGHWATVGAGAVVTKNVQDGATVAGNPARMM